MTDTGLSLSLIEKHFAGFRLGPITTTLRPGRAYGLLGPNGAGKTTLLNLIALQLRPSEGTISFNGTHIPWGDVAWKARFSYIRETPVFYDELSVSATVALASELYPNWDAPFATDLVTRFGLDRGKAVGTLSKGNRVKLGLVLALAHRSELLLLDEPTAGLDPTARADLQGILQKLMNDMPRLVLVLSSHIFEDIETVADEIIILRHGDLVFQQEIGTLGTLPVFRLTDGGNQLKTSDVRLAWRKNGQVWFVPASGVPVHGEPSPGWEYVAGGTTVAELYHATEHLCEPSKR
jgi:ABC-2 type transport system ATP-binding protein